MARPRLGAAEILVIVMIVAIIAISFLPPPPLKACCDAFAVLTVITSTGLGLLMEDSELRSWVAEIWGRPPSRARLAAAWAMLAGSLLAALYLALAPRPVQAGIMGSLLVGLTILLQAAALATYLRPR